MRIGYIQTNTLFDTFYCAQERCFIKYQCDKIIADKAINRDALIKTLLNCRPGDQVLLCPSVELLRLFSDHELDVLVKNQGVEIMPVMCRH